MPMASGVPRKTAGHITHEEMDRDASGINRADQGKAVSDKL